MADPTIQTTPNDYTTKNKAELVEILLDRDRSLASLAAKVRGAEHDIAARVRDFEQQLAVLREAYEARLLEAEQRATAKDKDKAPAVPREKRGVAKHLGKIDVFDIDTPEDVIERAMAVRSGHIPAAMAKRFRTDARLRAPAGTGLAKRLSKRPDTAVDVPLGTEFDRDEAKDEKGVDLLDVNDLYASGALIAVA